MTKAIIGSVDKKLYFGSYTFQADTTAAFENVLDLGKADAGSLEVVATITTQAKGGTNAKLVLKGSNNNSSYTEIVSTVAFPTASLTAGAVARIGIPRNTEYRYLKVEVTTTGVYSAGTAEAWLETYAKK